LSHILIDAPPSSRGHIDSELGAASGVQASAPSRSARASTLWRKRRQTAKSRYCSRSMRPEPARNGTIADATAKAEEFKSFASVTNTSPWLRACAANS
jgi:hypothetical protein